MRASDLTAEDIGRSFLVQGSDGRDRRRIVYEGTTHQPVRVDESVPYWLILMSSPSPMLMWFRTPAGQVFSGVVVRSNSEVIPLEVDWAVTEDGEIVETAVRPASAA